MFARNSANGQSLTGHGANGRRAFRDVTNAGGRGNPTDKSKKGGGAQQGATKRSGPMTRSMASSNKAPSDRAKKSKTTNNSNDAVVARGGDVAAAEQKAHALAAAAVASSMSISSELAVPPISNKVLAKADPQSYQMTGNMDNIDARDKDDPLCATAYVHEMYTHYRNRELVTSVRPVYMEHQPHINERMRSILVDWLIEVHLKFKLVPETLYLTINLIDRFLERAEVSRPRLQLVGVTSLLIASKYEEIYPPELRDLVYICDRAYTKQDIIEMEENILKTLEYNVTISSAHTFLVRFLKAGHADKKIVQLSCYLLDGTLQSYNLLHYLPSQLAAAAVFIARRTVGRNAWSPTLLTYADYCEEEIIPVAKAMLTEKSNGSPELRAVTKKYSIHRYGQVADTTLDSDF